MILYCTSIALALLALHVQWKDGVRGFGTTNGTQNLARSLWVFVAVSFGIALGRDVGVPLGLVSAIAAYLAADRLVAVMDRLAVRCGPRRGPEVSARPLAHLEETERVPRDRAG